MAEVKAEISVAVERAIHDGLRAALQDISTKHHIQILSVEIDWETRQVIGFPTEFRVRSLRVATESTHET